MTDRQRVILSLVQGAPTTPTSTHLMKWLFFVPYLYGPYSFVAGREMDSLRAAGLLAPEELRVPSKATVEATAESDKLKNGVRGAVAELLGRIGRWSRAKVVDDVYGRYPWYASRSVSRGVPAPQPAEAAVYTVGYEGRSADAFLSTLLQAFTHKSGASSAARLQRCARRSASNTATSPS